MFDIHQKTKSLPPIPFFFFVRLDSFAYFWGAEKHKKHSI